MQRRQLDSSELHYKQNVKLYKEGQGSTLGREFATALALPTPHGLEKGDQSVWRCAYPNGLPILSPRYS